MRTRAKASTRQSVPSKLHRHRTGLWERVGYWRTKLIDSSNYPALDGLESSWQLLNAHYDGVVKRDEDEKTANNPLSSLCFHVELGFYPPPEILLAICDALSAYKASQGQMSLEEAFFGPPKRKAGNYARQFARDIWKLSLYMEFDRLIRDGLTKAKAAEILSEKRQGNPSPETIARMIRVPDPTKRRNN